jgi:hypothetical protein
MRAAREGLMGRRDFLLTTTIGSLALSLGVAPSAAEDRPATHNMLVFGERAVFLSHLPMFNRPNADGTAFLSPHRYQVILEAALTPEQLASYVKDQQAHPGTRFYTLGPEEFVLSHLFTPEGAPQRTSFTATIFRGHLEEPPPKPVPGLDNTVVKIARVVHGRMFHPGGSEPAALEYLLLGRGTERFLAHAIFKPPDFDHVLPANLIGVDLTDSDLNQSIRVVIPGRTNVAAQRLRQGQRVDAMLHVGSTPPRKVQVEAGPQIYFEEGELLVPPTFDPTPEEKKQ